MRTGGGSAVLPHTCSTLPAYYTNYYYCLHALPACAPVCCAHTTCCTQLPAACRACTAFYVPAIHHIHLPFFVRACRHCAAHLALLFATPCLFPLRRFSPAARTAGCCAAYRCAAAVYRTAFVLLLHHLLRTPPRAAYAWRSCGFCCVLDATPPRGLCLVSTLRWFRSAFRFRAPIGFSRHFIRAFCRNTTTLLVFVPPGLPLDAPPAWCATDRMPLYARLRTRSATTVRFCVFSATTITLLRFYLRSGRSHRAVAFAGQFLLTTGSTTHAALRCALRAHRR